MTAQVAIHEDLSEEWIHVSWKLTSEERCVKVYSIEA